MVRTYMTITKNRKKRHLSLTIDACQANLRVQTISNVSTQGLVTAAEGSRLHTRQKHHHASFYVMISMNIIMVTINWLSKYHAGG